MPHPLRLDVFAELSFRMSSGATRSSVLEAANVDEAQWDVSQQFWLAKMADDAARNRFTLAQKYGALYNAAQARLAEAAAIPAPPKPREVSKEVVVHAIPVAAPPPVAPGPVAPPAPVAHSARLSVEQLAAMRAEIMATPEAQHGAVKQRFGLDEATWTLEEAHWQRRLSSDADLYKRYLRQFQYCRALLPRT
jgi:hypothetical protein